MLSWPSLVHADAGTNLICLFAVITLALVAHGTRAAPSKLDPRPIAAIPEDSDMNDYQFSPHGTIREVPKVGYVYGRPGGTHSSVFWQGQQSTDETEKQNLVSPGHALATAELKHSAPSLRGSEWTRMSAKVSAQGSQLSTIGIGSGKAESVKKEVPLGFGIRRSSVSLPSILLQERDLPHISPPRNIVHAGSPGSGLAEQPQGAQPILPPSSLISRRGDPNSRVKTHESGLRVSPQKTATSAIHLSSLRSVYPKWASAAGAAPIVISPPSGTLVLPMNSKAKVQKQAGLGRPEPTTVFTATTTRN